MPLLPLAGEGRRRLTAASAAVLLAGGSGVTAWALTTDPALPAPAAAGSVTSRLVVEHVPSASQDRPPSVTDVRPTAAPTPAVLPRSAPVRVRVPQISVDSELVTLGLLPDGALEVPDRADIAGWYTGSPTPGELGPSVLAGHVDSTRGPGVFFRLRELAPGNVVEVDRADGTTARFRVQRVEQHRKDAFPTARVYGDVDRSELRLITCGGTFDRSTGHYRSNVVVYARAEA